MNTSVQNINKITLQPLHGQALIDAVARDDLYKSFLGCPDPKDVVSLTLNGFFPFVMLQDEIPVGFIAFRQYTDLLIEFHGGIYKKYRGSSTPRIVQGCLNFIRNNCNNMKCKFITAIPEENKAAIRVVRNLKFKYLTTIPSATQDNKNLEMYIEE